MKIRPLPVKRSRCTICGGSTKQTIHPKGIYAATHSYPYDDEDANHQAEPAE